MRRYLIFIFLLACLLTGGSGNEGELAVGPAAEATGSAEQRLSTPSTTEESPSASNGPGSEIVQISKSNAGNGHASWSPDGTQIVFVSDRSGTWESIHF